MTDDDGDPASTSAPDDNAHGTRPLRYEQLLVGGKADVYEPMAAERGNNAKK